MVAAGEKVEEGNNDVSKEEVVGGNNDYVVAAEEKVGEGNSDTSRKR